MKKATTPTTLAMCGLLLAAASTHAADVEIKIMYATTPSVRSAWGGSSNTNSKISLKYLSAVATHADAETGVSLTRVDNFEATYDESNVTSETQIDRLTSGTQLTGVRNARNDRKADLVQLVCNWTDTSIAGKGSKPGWASIVNSSSFNEAVGDNSFTSSHEVGHNLNGDHSHGYCIPGIFNWRTIMRPNVNASCDSYKRINTFSSSSVLYFGAVGDKYYYVATGDSTHKNRERVREQRSTAAAYK